ncbi:cellulose biosynthesis cyclic di-GMP-binding regulatory protein BcsB [Pseudomonas sp. AN-1]|uniref:cellulose biosynthesis cyclic di-GMP-binding regulatory protein BcsB n=1 Tax=Pseudomonas sp. AN-1 TaxID=3096605 RepID=UPI002A6A2910|nr:cellulose biosynthesis cyclic di-GMP-binding regulatory protein BcsB [Pseudomonas sp. AN-1]WPP45056.1 cellulose biosynthesis cyclic di-GMP-binding regulatory protein BcsB [Pseudomonas sp. AN-1]
MTLSFKPWLAALILFASTRAALAVAAADTGALPAAPLEAPAALALAEPVEPPVPAWQDSRRFAELGRSADVLLLGIRNSEQIEFGLRRDRLVTAARLSLEYTPSPALLPTLSHLRVYLNDRLMGVLAIDHDQPGQQVRRELPLDPRLLGDFNRLRLEFVGHYAEICEDPANSALWLSLSRDSAIHLDEQALSLPNDLAHFPAPFFDPRDSGPLELPVVFAGAPTVGEQRAAAVLASHFGRLADWRGVRFPVLFDRLPAVAGKRPPQPTLVFATNTRRPAFMADPERFPAVEGPVLELIDHPDSPYGTLLLVRGRDEADLQRAVEALALGSPLLRGTRVTVGELPPPTPRRPYDAPKWAPTDRPVRLAELLDYPQQLQVSGLQPAPINLDIHLPPDLFVWRNQGIPLRTQFRYSVPGNSDESRLDVHLNDQFIASLALPGREQRSGVEEMRLAVTGEAEGLREKLLVPALKVGDRNRLSYAFNFASVQGSAQRDRCQTMLPVAVHGSIDEASTIDLSGYHHYLAMPDLRAFARSGFPFSRMADLSETLVLVPRQASEAQVATLLETLGGLGAQIGYPALGVRLSDDWQAARAADADLLLLGDWPAELRERADFGVRLAAPYDRLLAGQPVRAQPTGRQVLGTVTPQATVQIAASAPIAAVAGLQSPFHAQRSIVALLASGAEDYALLRDTLADPGAREGMAGSLALIRSSGVHSQFVGEPYYVGELPWWLLLWFHLSEHPLLVAALSALSVVLGAFLVWYLLRGVARRRRGEA